MPKILDSDDDDDDNSRSRQSPLLQTQRFTKSGTLGSKDFKATSQSKPKHNEVPNLKINLNHITDDNEDDSLNTSDDNTNTRTGRSTSSGTTSQLTPKPKERLFLKDREKPTTKPRHIDIDDDERNVFGQSTMKPSPRHTILSSREEEENHQSFMNDFKHEKKRQSPTDIFAMDNKFDSRKNIKKLSKDQHNSDDDDENLSSRQTKQNDFRKSQHSPMHSERSQSQKHSNKSKDEIDQSDDDDHSNKQTKQNDFRKSQHSPMHSEKSQPRRNSNKSKDEIDQSDDDDDQSNKQSTKQYYAKPRQPTHDPIQTSTKDTDFNAHQHQSASSRPGSGSKKEMEHPKRSSLYDDQDTIIPSTTDHKPQSRPTSAKSNTTRQHTQSAIDNITSANIPQTLDPLTTHNEALAAALQPPPPPPRPSARLPPRPKSSFNATQPTGGHRQKSKIKVSSRYKEITSRVDCGRTPVSEQDLKQSVERAMQKELKSQTLPRPQSARSRNQSANSNNSGRQRRRSSSGYEHIGPRVNTNLSVNFDELNTTQMRAESSQSIKDGVYLEWLKTKEEQRRFDKEESKRWKEAKSKTVDKSNLERKISQDAQNLERWRQDKEEEMKKKRHEQLEIQREVQENKKREQQQKKKDAKDGFEDWTAKKVEQSKEKDEDIQKKKSEIEHRQEEKQKKIFEAEKAYEKWMNKKTTKIQKTDQEKKSTRDEELKKIRGNEETKFVEAQEAYEKWLKQKEKYELEENGTARRRNSTTVKQQPVPFLPGGSQKNTGKVRHEVW